MLSPMLGKELMFVSRLYQVYTLLLLCPPCQWYPFKGNLYKGLRYSLEIWDQYPNWPWGFTPLLPYASKSMNLPRLLLKCNYIYCSSSQRAIALDLMSGATAIFIAHTKLLLSPHNTPPTPLFYCQSPKFYHSSNFSNLGEVGPYN